MSDFVTNDKVYETTLKLRPLGASECLRVAMHDLRFHNNVALVATITNPQFQDRLRPVVFYALSAAIQNHPALSSTVVATDQDCPYFLRLEKIDLTLNVFFNKAAEDKHRQIDEILSIENSYGFSKPDLPLWRVIILENQQPEAEFAFDMFFIWHHVIGDGRSGLAVFSTIMDALSTLELGNDGRLTENCALKAEQAQSGVVRSSCKSLEPPLEELIRIPVPGRLSIPNIVMTTEDQSARWDNPEIRNFRPFISTPNKTNIRHITIPALSLGKILSQCRAQSTTLTPLIMALVEKVVFEALRDMYHIKCAVAMSLRRFFPVDFGIDDTLMGFWVSAIQQVWKRAEIFDSGGRPATWTLARKNTEKIRGVIRDGGPVKGIGRKKNVEGLKFELMNKIGEPRVNGCGITNLGAFPIQSGEASDRGWGSWSVRNLVFSQSCHVTGSVLQICIVGLKKGNLSITASWQENILDIQVVDQILAHLNAELLDCGCET